MDLRTFGLTSKTFKIFILNKFLKQKAILKILQYPLETPVLEPIFKKVADLYTCNVFKKRPQHKFFFYKYCRIFNTTYFEKHLQTVLDCCRSF